MKAECQPRLSPASSRPRFYWFNYVIKRKGLGPQEPTMLEVTALGGHWWRDPKPRDQRMTTCQSQCLPLCNREKFSCVALGKWATISEPQWSKTGPGIHRQRADTCFEKVKAGARSKIHYYPLLNPAGAGGAGGQGIRRTGEHLSKITSC